MKQLIHAMLEYNAHSHTLNETGPLYLLVVRTAPQILLTITLTHTFLLQSRTNHFFLRPKIANAHCVMISHNECLDFESLIVLVSVLLLWNTYMHKLFRFCTCDRDSTMHKNWKFIFVRMKIKHVAFYMPTPTFF